MMVDHFSAMADLLMAFSGKRVLVVGDYMVDEYIWGDVQRISPEAPVPVVNVKQRTYLAGGAGNVVTNIAALRGVPLPAGVVGNDFLAEQLFQAFNAHGIQSTQGLLRSSNRPTTVKSRVVAHNQQVLRMDVEETTAIEQAEESALLTWMKDRLDIVDLCVLSDYAKGVLTERVCQGTIRLCRERGIRTIVDPKGRNFEKYRGATVITPNVSETLQAANLAGDWSVERAVRTLQQECLGSHILVTRGSEGMSLFFDNSDVLHVPANARNVYDVTGAGDTVVAVLSMALACNAELEQAVRLANMAAGVVVGRFGTATVTQSDLFAVID